MSMNEPWILYVTSDPPDQGSVFQLTLKRLADAVEQHGIKVVRAHSCEDGLVVARGSASYSAVLIDWDLGETADMREEPVVAIIRAVREKSLRLPIFLLTRNLDTPDLPWNVVSEVREYVNLPARRRNFFARRMQFAIDDYHAGLLPPYFKALKQLTEKAPIQWDAPGTWAAPPTQAPGRRRNSTDSSARTSCARPRASRMPSCGSWLDIEGPPAESQRMARAHVRRRLEPSTCSPDPRPSNRSSSRPAGRQRRDGGGRPQLPQIAEPRDDAGGFAGRCTFQPSRNGYGMIG
jgi:arginine decarboxylase